MPDASTCPRCGAPLTGSPDRARVCDYCKADVPAAAPERVVIREVIERVVAVEQTGKTNLRCPRCTAALFEGRTSATTMLGCGGCGGVWLDNAGTRRLLGLVDAEMVTLADRASVAATAAPSFHEEREPLRCPMGGEELGRAMVSDVTVDVCAVHGTWFDKNELHRIWSQLLADHRPAYDYGPAADRALENERHARAFFDALFRPSS